MEGKYSKRKNTKRTKREDPKRIKREDPKRKNTKRVTPSTSP
jgi:hypothetical protein